MTDTSKDTLFEFPCDFPLKVMGRKTDDFRSIVLGIVQKHAGPIEARRTSRIQNIECFGEAIQPVELGDVWLDLAALEQIEQRFQVRRVNRRLFARVRAPEHADQ